MNFHGITKIFVTLQIIMLKTTHNRKEKKNNQKNKMQSNYLNILKKYAADIVVVILFALVSVAYFMPAVSEGRILYRHDASAGRGAGQLRLHSRACRLQRCQRRLWRSGSEYE